MKTRILALLFAIAMAFSLVGCGKSADNATAQTYGPVGTNNEVPLDKELILIDNENITITATAKFEEKKVNANGYHEVGYRILVENHSDYYVLITGDQLSVDGFMVDGRLFDLVGKLNPNTKAYYSISIYVDETTSNNPVETMEQLCKVDGLFEVSKNADGSMYYESSDWGGEFHID